MLRSPFLQPSLLETVYNYEPITPQIPPSLAHHVLGVQAQIWTEYMPTPQQVEYMCFPRMAALAEVAWSPAVTRDFADFTLSTAVIFQTS